MSQLDVVGQLQQRFSAPLPEGSVRRIVVWFDAQGEFEEVFDTLAESGFDNPVQGGRRIGFLKAVDGSMFLTKRLLYRQDTSSDFVVYRKRSSTKLEGDWLADIGLYAECFQADYLSSLMEEMGASDAGGVREALSCYKAFFAAKDRIARFKACMPQATSADDIRAGMFAVVLGKVEPRTSALVRAYLMRLADEAARGAEGQTLAKLERYGARGAFETFLREKTGYEGSLDSLDTLSAHVLLTALSCTVPESVTRGLEGCIAAPYAQFCLVIVHDWMDTPEEDAQQVLFDLCRNVEKLSKLEHRFEQVPSSALLQSDIFPCLNETLAQSLMLSLAQGANRGDEARLVVQTRKNLKWYKRVSCYFDAIDAAVDMQEFHRLHIEGFHLSNAQEVWNAYGADWWQMDAAYRHFCVAYELCVRDASASLTDSLEQLAEWVDNLYVHWFLTEVNACWVRCAEPAWYQAGFIEGVPLQRGFYNDVVRSELAAAKRVVVIVSDALRYEVGKQLADRLERETRGVVRTEAVQGTFPSITSFGMAALLPHRAMTVGEEDMSVLLDGMPTASTLQREAVLQVACPENRAITAKFLLEMKRQDRKDLARDAQVVYVYHNAIDAIGEDQATEHNVFAACDTAIDDLSALVKIAINDMASSRVMVVADHGFLYTRRVLSEHERIASTEVGTSAVCIAERYALVQGDAPSEVFVRMNMDAVEGGQMTGLAPRGFVHIKRPGGGGHYVHGGISLEELCVPVIFVQSKSAKAKGVQDAQPATLQLLSTNRRITSLMFNVRLYQPSPAVGKIFPAEYELVFVDKEGTEISDMRKAVADKTSDDAQSREMQVRFTLKQGRSYPSTNPYYLLTRDKHTHMLVWKEEFRIEIAFVPADDFGF
ncbi:MAG: BREX-1 system phosphatase PglZ type A [Gordonibacter sp.]